MALFGKTPEKSPDPSDGVLVHGSFACQSCGDRVTEARYLVNYESLVYKCDEGHKSIIREFGLDIT